ncbi:hypothetical protein AAES_161248 [Amazona aestiva]|uniref:Secreted protein n=1 Tax=Amazona aestiva TaxID=12930 RepID=A0A0Q3UQG8_AMAAE|nr:hypothetical protein AAES_161248 [Amazona aestiva]
MQGRVILLILTTIKFIAGGIKGGVGETVTLNGYHTPDRLPTAFPRGGTHKDSTSSPDAPQDESKKQDLLQSQEGRKDDERSIILHRCGTQPSVTALQGMRFAKCNVACKTFATHLLVVFSPKLRSVYTAPPVLLKVMD